MLPMLSRCALAAAAVLAASLVAPAALATDVEDARTEVEQLGREVEVAAEAYNEARVQTEAQKQQVAAAEARVASQSAAIEVMQDELGALAVETFKRGGVDPQLVALVGDAGGFTSTTSALTVMAERRSLSLTDLKAAQQQLDDLRAAAAAELEQVSAMEADLAAQKADIEARLDGAEDVLAAAEAEAARIEAARRAAAEQATRAREAAAAAAAVRRRPGAPAAPAAPGAAAPAGDAPTASAGQMNCGGVSVDVPTDRVATVLAFACSQLGKPYLWGAAGPERLRLLRLHDGLLGQGRRLPAPLLALPGRRRDERLAEPAPGRRPRLQLLPDQPRGHLPGRRAHDRRAVRRGRRQDPVAVVPALHRGDPALNETVTAGPDPTARRTSVRTRLPRRLALLATGDRRVALLAPAAEAATPDVEEARTQVAQLGAEVEAASAEYAVVEARLAAQQNQVAAAEARVQSQATLVQMLEAQVVDLAVETYKSGGVDPQLSLLATGSTDRVRLDRHARHARPAPGRHARGRPRRRRRAVAPARRRRRPSWRPSRRCRPT